MPSLRRSRAGTSLVEVLLAGTILALMAIGVSLFFLKSSRAGLETRQRFEANSLANSMLQDIQKIPYPLIPLTIADNGWFAATGNPGCDCATVNFAALPDNATIYRSVGMADLQVRRNITYRRQVCINQTVPTGPDTWSPRCPDVDDTGYKSIRILVSWQSSNSGQRRVTEIDGLAARN